MDDMRGWSLVASRFIRDKTRGGHAGLNTYTCHGLEASRRSPPHLVLELAHHLGEISTGSA